ncbi:hypothetical protein ACFQY5_22715 [Paeniroseomonas aquatica]|uniref:Secreted protein n=1 Tax=Paeniroseomonas aquatica TaxID=373043 RepID=A0ABT8A043_9PROT|nr:hypothetical protein [Paeniroseomonas aquatica]MDN3562904.1 hypothetical protein [Paeniroseomonas aquatica]
MEQLRGMRGFRHIVRLLLVAMLVFTFAPPLAAVSMHGAADHIHATDDQDLPGPHDAVDHAVTDHVHEAVTVRPASLAPRWMPRARLAILGQEGLAPGPNSRMERPPRGLG